MAVKKDYSSHYNPCPMHHGLGLFQTLDSRLRHLNMRRPIEIKHGARRGIAKLLVEMLLINLSLNADGLQRKVSVQVRFDVVDQLPTQSRPPTLWNRQDPAKCDVVILLEDPRVGDQLVSVIPQHVVGHGINIINFLIDPVLRDNERANTFICNLI